MNKVNYEDALRGLTEFLEELIADKLDVNRRHITVTAIYPQIVAEADYEDEDMNFDTYYKVEYEVDGDEGTMYWCHTESMATHGFSDVILDEREFVNCTNDGETA